MNEPSNILLLSSEVVPYAKTGGLADVVGALPTALHKLGYKVRVALPYYRMVKQGGFETKVVIDSLPVSISDRIQTCSVLETKMGDGDIPLYLIACDKYYDRDELYNTPQGDYQDNAERFMYFNRAVLEMLKALNYSPDIIHANDWQTGLIPLYLKTLYADEPLLRDTATLFTIHNLAYQGKFWRYDMHLTGLDGSYFTPEWLEFYGDINLLKAGILHSTLVNTVSPTYAQEIQDKEYGCGLDGVLRVRAHELYGVVNGIDYGQLDPKHDPLLAYHYDVSSLEGKYQNKADLQKHYHLPPAPDIPLIGMVTRLASQKGIDILTEAIKKLVRFKMQLVILGTGEEKFHVILQETAKRYPNKIGVEIAFDKRLAQLIYAGSDMFLMPSRYEPCGLGQLISLRYGTIPIVRLTGGLADTIHPLNRQNGQGNGFGFVDYSASELVDTVKSALATFRKPKIWKDIVTRAMQEEHSWETSAQEYGRLYQMAYQKKNKAAKAA